MENDNQQNPNIPQESPINPMPPTPTKKLSNKLIAIILLAVIAGIVIWISLSRQPKTDLSPIVINHKTQPELPATTTSQTSQNDLKDWKIYTNSQYNFQFYYPNEWKIDACGADYILINGHCDTDALYTGVIEISAEKNLDELLKPYKNISKSTVKISNIDAIKVEGLEVGSDEGMGPVSGTSELWVVFNYQGHTYSISLLQAPSEDYGKIFNQILSTFKFTNNLTATVPSCGNYFSNGYQPLDKQIADALSKNSDVSKFITQGYSLETVCNSLGQILSLFDFSTGYWQNAGKVSETQLTTMQGSLIIGVMDTQFSNGKFYNINIPDYRLEGEGGMACHFDKISGNYVLYICDDAADSGASTTWYAYDTNQKKNIQVQYKFEGFENSSSNSQKVYRADLIALFSKK